MLPTLVVVSGPAGGYGKTTLAHEIARAGGCPAICRDEIKEGMVHAAPPGFESAPADPRKPPDALTRKPFKAFFDVLALLLGSGSTVVAEAAFQGPVWRPELQRLADFAELRIVRCVVDPATANERNARRATQNPLRARAHPVTPGPMPIVHPFGRSRSGLRASTSTRPTGTPLALPTSSRSLTITEPLLDALNGWRIADTAVMALVEFVIVDSWGSLGPGQFRVPLTGRLPGPPLRVALGGVLGRPSLVGKLVLIGASRSHVV